MRVLVVLVLASRVLAAQQPPVTRLQPANGELKEIFHKVSMNERRDPVRQIRELRDGRLLILDDNLRIGDFATGKTAAFPDNKVKDGRLIALAGDSSIIAALDGWYFLDGTRVIGMLPRTNPLVSSISDFDGADAQGFLLTEVAQKKWGDSSTLVRVNRSTGDKEVIAKLWPGGRQPVAGEVCIPNERAGLTLDGWIAVVRDTPYRVDWRSPTGEWMIGQAIQTPVVPMTEREKEVYLQWRASERPLSPVETVPWWPDTVCPWSNAYRPMATPDGKLIVYRVPTSQAPATRYDVINRRGEVERQIALPGSEAILGFGAKSVYVVRTEGAGQTIHRHPWP